MLYIDPSECIDCDACVEACPVDAIFAEGQVPSEWQHYTTKNAAYYQNAWPPRDGRRKPENERAQSHRRRGLRSDDGANGVILLDLAASDQLGEHDVREHTLAFPIDSEAAVR
jgi:formate hydrogenlyase subunit 6/NADH:ubiquinone oxidoreductase subunit I